MTRSMGVPLPPFQMLVDAHWRDVSRLAHALAGPIDGDDVAQQAWLQAYAAYPSVTSARNLRGWLLTITHRSATDMHRARARRAEPVPDSSLAGHADRSGHSQAPAVAAADAALTDPALWSAVAALPPRQREALVLRYVADLDHAGIAAALGVTLTTSRRLVSDGLATLRKVLP
ncbi:MAG: RNA polymerase sigma factor [Candidatus Phosphoribacter sp.]